MKKILLAIIALSLFAGTSLAQKKTDLELAGLKGKITKHETITYKAIDKMGNAEKGSLISRVVNTYNDKGMQIKYEQYDSTNNLHITVESTYDQNNQWIGDSIYDSLKTTMMKTVFDEKGLLKERKYYNDEGILTSKRLNKYDKNGNIIELVVYNSYGNSNGKAIQKFDKKGNVLEYLEYDGDNALSEKWVATYDKKGNLSTKTFYDNEGKFNYKYSYKRNANGDVLETEAFDSDGDTYQWKFERIYDLKDNLIKTIQYSSEAKTPTQITEYKIEYSE